MKELDFKEMVVDNCKNYLSENISDNESYKNVLDYSTDALDGLLGLGFDFAAMQDVLTFYLLNSKECNEIKRENAAHVSKFVDAAQIIVRGNVYLGVLNKALFEMSEKFRPV